MNDAFEKLSDKERRMLLSILQTLRGIKFGTVHIVIQDSKVVQIEKTEKYRVDKENRPEYEI